jgi:hypothetical protein
MLLKRSPWHPIMQRGIARKRSLAEAHDDDLSSRVEHHTAQF